MYISTLSLRGPGPILYNASRGPLAVFGFQPSTFGPVAVREKRRGPTSFHEEPWFFLRQSHPRCTTTRPQRIFFAAFDTPAMCYSATRGRIGSRCIIAHRGSCDFGKNGRLWLGCGASGGALTARRGPGNSLPWRAGARRQPKLFSVCRPKLRCWGTENTRGLHGAL